jgi:hypothetical protein
MRRKYIVSASTMLIFFAVVEFMNLVFDAQVLAGKNLLFQIENRQLVLVAGTVFMTVGLNGMFSKRFENVVFQFLLTGLVLFGYHAIHWFFKIPDSCPCLNFVVKVLGLSSLTAKVAIYSSIVFLIVPPLYYWFWELKRS